MSSQNYVTDCFFNLTTDERIELFKKRQGLRLETVYRTYFGWMALPFSLFGLIITTLFIIVVYDAIKKRRVSRKCYILLLNRAVGDFLTCLTALVSTVYVFTAREINRDVLSLLELFLVGTFWSAMTSYVSLSLLKLFAVARPFDYRKCVTMKRCMYLILVSWLVFILLVTYSLGMSALVKVPFLNEWSHCKAETCLRFMYRSRNIVSVCLYFFTLVVFVVLIQRAQRFVDSFKKGRTGTDSVKTSRFPLWKLALNVSTFAGLYLFYVCWCLGLLFLADQCTFMRNLAELMRILGFVRLSIILRICIDPILSFITDFQIRRGFLALFGVHRKITFSSSRGIFQKTTIVNEDNSSEGASNSSRRDTERRPPHPVHAPIPKDLVPDRVDVSSPTVEVHSQSAPTLELATEEDIAEVKKA